MSVDLDRLKGRIRALLAKTVANGCTEAEALAAAEKAFALMQAHGIASEYLEIGKCGASLGRSRRQQIDELWGSVAVACRCVCFRARMPDGSLRIEFVGQQPWPEIAEWLRGALTGAHGRALSDYKRSPAYLRRRTARTRAAARRQFTRGFVDGVREAVVRLVTDWSTLEQDLAVARAALQAEYGPTTKSAPLGVGQRGANTAADREAGRAAGRQTPVNWAVRGGAAKALASDPQQGARHG